MAGVVPPEGSLRGTAGVPVQGIREAATGQRAVARLIRPPSEQRASERQLGPIGTGLRHLAHLGRCSRAASGWSVNWVGSTIWVCNRGAKRGSCTGGGGPAAVLWVTAHTTRHRWGTGATAWVCNWGQLRSSVIRGQRGTVISGVHPRHPRNVACQVNWRYVRSKQPVTGRWRRSTAQTPVGNCGVHPVGKWGRQNVEPVLNRQGEQMVIALYQR